MILTKLGAGLMLAFAYLIAVSPAAEDVYTASTNPSAIVEKAVSVAKADPSQSPEIFVDVVGKFANYLTAADLEKALNLLFETIADQLPEQLLPVLRATSGEYPNLAIQLAKSCVKASPASVEDIIYSVMESSPQTDAEQLSLAVSSALDVPQSSIEYMFSEFYQAGFDFPSIGGGGGAPIYGK
jgi:hypothetical protein